MTSAGMAYALAPRGRFFLFDGEICRSYTEHGMLLESTADRSLGSTPPVCRARLDGGLKEDKL
ncbi:hypothetical protein Heshes_05300 [Alicyclobacillus hesperidum]|uniref:Uncharacterized protein n=1 Tax=Alicyclobacillus hesperidum TaxID=89784 RepID=A0AA37X182_9BACL|nr:hypothetical protein Heshes_05300 [Alicyclobacillus hesperidum]